MKFYSVLTLGTVLTFCVGVQAQTSGAPTPATSGASAPAVPAQVVDPAAMSSSDAGGDQQGRIWADAEYLLWWMKGVSLPPLVTASPAGTAAAQAGVLGAPGTVVLFGGNHVNDDARSGFRITLGGWLDDCQTIGVEGDFFMLESKGSGFAASSSGDPILARPFFNVATGQSDSQLLAFPGLLSGSVFANAASTGLLGADALLRYNVCCGCCYRLDVVGGYRYLRLSDHLDVTEDLVSTSATNPNFVPVGTTIFLNDQFDTRNEFNGGDIGLRAEVRRGPWVLQGRADVAVGNNHEVLDISGFTTVTVPGFAPVTNPGGLLALSSNIGHFTKDRVEVIPEFDARIGYQLTDHLQVFVGYTFLYWSSVLRAGNQVDVLVNPTLLPGAGVPVVGPQRPAPLLGGTSFWAQGIDLGFTLRF
jgi:hypothetical protein